MVFGRIRRAERDATMSLYLGPGSYIIGERGGIWVSGHAVRIEGCTFDGCKVVVTQATDVGLSDLARLIAVWWMRCGR